MKGKNGMDDFLSTYIVLRVGKREKSRGRIVSMDHISKSNIPFKMFSLKCDLALVRNG